MPKSLRFDQVVRLLGRDDSDALAALDYLTTGVLVATAPVTGGLSLAFVDVKNDAVRLAARMRSTVKARRAAAIGLGRSDVIAAAHVLTVMISFFEAVDAQVPELSEAHLTRSEQLFVGAGRPSTTTMTCSAGCSGPMSPSRRRTARTSRPGPSWR